jgi:hypothetical protein
MQSDGLSGEGQDEEGGQGKRQAARHRGKDSTNDGGR